MRRTLLLGVLAALAAAVPAVAQNRGGRASVTPPRHTHQFGSQGTIFIPGIGLRPIIRERVPGWGFDFHHFNTTRRHHHFLVHPGFFGGFHRKHGFGFASFPFFPTFSTSTVVVVPQFVPVEVPVIIQSPVVREVEEPRAIIVTAGLPDNWNAAEVAREPIRNQQVAPPLLTLLVLKDGTIIPARDYWLQEDQIFYVTSTGREDSFALRELDWEMSARLNADRNIEFVVRASR